MPCFMLLAHASHSPPRSAPKLSRFFEFLVWQQIGRASREAGTPSCEDSQTSDVDPIRGLSQHGPTAHPSAPANALTDPLKKTTQPLLTLIGAPNGKPKEGFVWEETTGIE